MQHCRKAASNVQIFSLIRKKVDRTSPFLWSQHLDVDQRIFCWCKSELIANKASLIQFLSMPVMVMIGKPNSCHQYTSAASRDEWWLHICATSTSTSLDPKRLDGSSQITEVELSQMLAENNLNWYIEFQFRKDTRAKCTQDMSASRSRWHLLSFSNTLDIHRFQISVCVQGEDGRQICYTDTWSGIFQYAFEVEGCRWWRSADFQTVSRTFESCNRHRKPHNCTRKQKDVQSFEEFDVWDDNDGKLHCKHWSSKIARW